MSQSDLDLATFENETHPARTISEATWAWMVDHEEMEMNAEHAANMYTQGFCYGGIDNV